MSVTNRNDVKMILPRSGPDHFWRVIAEHFAGTDKLRWKYLAMLALRENGGWPLDWIGAVFNHPKGHVTRCLQNIKRQLREHFEPEALNVDACFSYPEADGSCAECGRPY